MNKSNSPQIRNLTGNPIALQQLIDKMPSGILILDKSHRVVQMNRALEALTGFSAAKAKGLPCYHVLRSTLCVTKCPVRHRKGGFEPVSNETDLIDRSRELIPININTAPLKDVKGNVALYLEAIEDLRAIRNLDEKVSQAFSFANIVGRSGPMEKIFQILPVLAQSDSSVLITGETGTGKDLVAEALHQASNRSKAPFIKVNCGALPENLLESELFGHQKGAFTGATENKHGRFRLAHNGTLYLTEIGDLPLTLQVKLLTFLDDQVIYPLGGTSGFQANVRVMAGTHRNLEQMVKEGRFRNDLLFRLNVVRVHLPPLRSREGDLHLLLDHFIHTLNDRFQKNISGISKGAMKFLNRYSFPGNVRELRNIVEYAANICESRNITPEHLPAYILEGENSTTQKETVTPNEMDMPSGSDVMRTPNIRSTPFSDTKNWSDMEQQMIMNALLEAGGRRNVAAEKLGWGRSTLWRKIKKYGLD